MDENPIMLIFLASHPVWVRGLKHPTATEYLGGAKVAPRVGAWIETLKLNSGQLPTVVAPRVGAWIETKYTEGI